MPILKTNKFIPFEKLHRGAPFALNITLYTRSNGAEDPKEYFFYKLNHNSAVTVDKRNAIHMLPNEVVELCTNQKKQLKNAA